jgi:hypothetical protein
LRIKVTQDELLLILPMTWLMGWANGGGQCIKKQDIVSVRDEKKVLIGRVVIVEFRQPSGRKDQVELIPRDINAFKQALE